ncbi:MAG: T9SS type A sorting domain-containing protein [Bacteroidetes bacterium]|nr:T9SS type A sorting domain-containing protein [Bacteroidota bacterium]
MKQVVFATLAAFLMASGSVRAQSPITLTNTGYATNNADTLGIVNNFSSFANLGTPAANASWDLSLATYATTFLQRERLNPPTSGNPFPGASYYEPSHYSFASGALSYNSDVYKQLSGGGLISMGENMSTATAIFIGAVTGGTNDSLVFPAQTITYLPQITDIKFPASADSSWMSANTKYTTLFSLTVAAMSLNHTPGERRSSRTTIDSVMGWGKIRVALKAGGNSVWIPVLQVRYSEEITDSFYLGGAPAPAALLSNFGLAQGQLSGSYKILFYAASDATPIAAMEYTDNTYGTLSELKVKATGEAPSSVKTTGLVSQVKIYPNPAQSSLNIEVPGNQFNDWHYTLTNMAGQQVAAGSLPFQHAQKATINLPNGLTPGIYSIRLTCAEASASSSIIIE